MSSTGLRFGALAILFLSAAYLSSQETPAMTAEAIMARVAANQDRALELRAQYIYEQHIRIDTRHFNGKLARQETADYVITPTPSGIENKLQKLDGKYQQKKAYVEFHTDTAPKQDGLDASLIGSFRDELLLNKESKDGLESDLFPLTTEQQKKFRFKLLGEQDVKGRRAFRIGFGPEDRHELAWAGEALIDAEEFQPINVFTKLSRRIPFAVRTFLGTDLPGVGFNVQYVRVDKDVWFPASFGSEFRLHILFFLKRDVSISSESTGFKRANVESTIKFATP